VIAQKRGTLLRLVIQRTVVLRCGSFVVPRTGQRGTMIIRSIRLRLWEMLVRPGDQRNPRDTGNENAYFPLFIPPESYLKAARPSIWFRGFSAP